jgi:CRISPR/Cas system-associated protein Cas5 (RAMP superfamily)
MASMIYIAAYQRNFSSALGNDPQMPVTYETQYQTLLKSAISEENRKKFEAAAWSSQSVSTTATPTRG